jgi:hypothetical protein
MGRMLRGVSLEAQVVDGEERAGAVIARDDWLTVFSGTSIPSS